MGKPTLIRNACILTMDAELGDFERGEILIEGSKIKDVGAEVEVSSQAADAIEVVDADGAIAIPGLVDAHRHVWQANIRYQTSNWSMMEYALTVRGFLADTYAPEDKYLGNYAGCLEALDSGVTTLVDYDHNIGAPEFADAAISATADSGVRSVYCYGMGGIAKDGKLFDSFKRPEWKQEDYERIAKTYFSDDTGRLHLGIALNELPFQSVETLNEEVGWAREHGAKAITFHLSARDKEGEENILRLADLGLLGADMLAVHGFFMQDRELELMAEAGASVVATIESEMQMGMGYGATLRAKKFGVNHALGVDIVSNNSGDMFAPMRLSLQTMRAFENQAKVDAGEMVTSISIGAREVLEAATLGGAKAAGLDDRIGSLTPGKEADIVLIDRNRVGMQPVGDPVAAVVLYASLANVDWVMVGGQVVKQGGRLVGVDQPALFERLGNSNKAILDRVAAVHEKLGDGMPMPKDLVQSFANK